MPLHLQIDPLSGGNVHEMVTLNLICIKTMTSHDVSFLEINNIFLLYVCIKFELILRIRFKDMTRTNCTTTSPSVMSLGHSHNT